MSSTKLGNPSKVARRKSDKRKDHLEQIIPPLYRRGPWRGSYWSPPFGMWVRPTACRQSMN
jgi:hypothetical protein